MSYGQYMNYISTKQPEPEKEPEPETTSDPVEEKPKKYCIVCGKEIPKHSQKKLYCGKYCYSQKIREEARERARKKYGISSEDVLTCPTCGKEFVRGDRHGSMKYCSKECSDKRKIRRKKKEKKERKKKAMIATLDPGAKLPVRAHKYDGGLDLFAKENIKAIQIPARGSVTIDTGVHLQIPKHFVGLVKSKSGMMVRNKILTDGTVDADYTGSIHVTLFNHGDSEYTVEPGAKIAQLVIVPCCLPPLELADKLEPTERGNNGFGSTGMF